MCIRDRWRLILEEYGPELIYTKGSTNTVADALSRLETEPTNEPIAEAKNSLFTYEKLTPGYVGWRNVKYLYHTSIVQLFL